MDSVTIYLAINTLAWIGLTFWIRIVNRTLRRLRKWK